MVASPNSISPPSDASAETELISFWNLASSAASITKLAPMGVLGSPPRPAASGAMAIAKSPDSISINSSIETPSSAVIICSCSSRSSGWSGIAFTASSTCWIWAPKPFPAKKTNVLAGARLTVSSEMASVPAMSSGSASGV